MQKLFAPASSDVVELLARRPRGGGVSLRCSPHPTNRPVSTASTAR